jgi:hypothetical protein
MARGSSLVVRDFLEIFMRHRRNLIAGAGLGAAIVALGIGQHALEAWQGGTIDAPRFEVDPMWPKPLPNHWVLGNVIGVGVDARDHVYIVHRQDTVNDSTENGLGAKTSE